MSNFKEKMKQRKKLIGNRAINSDEAIGLAFHDSNKKVSLININVLNTNPYQPRISIDDEELSNLANNINENGLLQPILVTPIENNPNKFYIVAGHRRVEATKKLGKTEIEAIIYPISEENLQIYSIIENIQRENLTPLEEAFAIKKLVDAGISQTDICQKISKSKSTISKLLKITSLEDSVLEYIKNNKIELGASILYEIVNLDSKDQLKALLNIEKKSMNRIEVRDYISNLKESNIVSPAKQYQAFIFSKKKNTISFKLNMDKLTDKNEAIETLENLLKDLKNL